MAKAYASELIKTALAEVGYHEKKTNSQLESKTANSGGNNYTKYANYIDKNCPSFYNAKKNELGPSGGLMMALYVYNALTEEDITQGKDLYGTGTIELDGTVGEIDGIKYKLLGAYKKGAKYFIVPESNYEESIKVKEDKKLDIEIISVTTFDDALNKIKELK